MEKEKEKEKKMEMRVVMGVLSSHSYINRIINRKWHGNRDSSN